jgi:hypothetical protein
MVVVLLPNRQLALPGQQWPPSKVHSVTSTSSSQLGHVSQTTSSWAKTTSDVASQPLRAVGVPIDSFGTGPRQVASTLSAIEV